MAPGFAVRAKRQRPSPREAELIFRYLYRRRMLEVFGRFIPASRINELTAGTSEWHAFKSFLPMRWFRTEDEIANSLLEVRRLARNALDEAERHRNG